MFEELLEWRDVVIVDTETTGFGANAQVIQVAVPNTRGEPLMNELVRAKEEIPAGATQIYDWTRRKLRRHGAWRWARVYPKLRKHLERANAVHAGGG